MSSKRVIIASIAMIGTEIASELSGFGITAVVRPEFSGEIPEDTGAVVIDNSTGEMEEVIKNISYKRNIFARTFVLTDAEDPMVYEEGSALFISSKLGAESISKIVEFCINPAYDMDKVIKKSLYDLGFLSNLRGHRYIREAIKIILDNPKSACNMHKDVYEIIGKMHGCNKNAIERSIRYSIETAYGRDKGGSFENFFGPLHRRPTNSEFLTCFVEQMQMKKA